MRPGPGAALDRWRVTGEASAASNERIDRPRGWLAASRPGGGRGAADVHERREAMTSQEAAQATDTHPADAIPARILVADDEPGIRAFIGRALNAAGYLTDFAATGAEALRRALDGHYDLIILDLVMPEMTGQVALERLLAARPEQAVLVLSCLGDVASKVECLERGAQYYLTKPFSLAELLARVRLRLRGWPGELAHDRAGEVIRAGSLTLDVG